MIEWSWDEAKGQWFGGVFNAVGIADHPIRRVCGCSALNHPLHPPGQCDEPAQPTGEGICYTCRQVKSPAR